MGRGGGDGNPREMGAAIVREAEKRGTRDRILKAVKIFRHKRYSSRGLYVCIVNNNSNQKLKLNFEIVLPCHATVV